MTRQVDGGSQIQRGDDPWAPLRELTQARIGLGRAGNSMPTTRLLEFRSDLAAARDAVTTPLDVRTITEQIEALPGGHRPAYVRSLAQTRSEYLRRPDLGRTPDPDTMQAAVAAIRHHDMRGRPRLDGSPPDVVIVLADGLSPLAVARHGVPMLSAILDTLDASLTIAPPVVATQSRVALGDHIAHAVDAQTLIVLIGERPGLSVADSLGIYLTHRAKPGCSDAERNCISNIHPPEGLTYVAGARVTANLVAGSRRLGRSGITLKADPVQLGL